MKSEYDFSKLKSRKNPYASKLKQPVTMRLPESASPSTKPLTPNMLPQTIRCNSISYRKGFVEVSRVHDGCVNLESWSVHSEAEISGIDIHDERIDDEDITGNVELELDIEAAERLIAALQAAVDELRGEMKTEYDLSQPKSRTNPYASKLKKPA